jgi:hypothetical protein
VLQEFKLENLTVREREVGCSPVIRQFEFVFLTVGNPYRNGRRERISLSETMIYQWTSLGLGLMVKKDNVPRPYISCILVGAVNGALQNVRGGARHREKFGLVPPQSLAGAARSVCGVSCNARHTGQLLSRARGQRAESRGKVYEGRVWE